MDHVFLMNKTKLRGLMNVLDDVIVANMVDDADM